MDLGTLYVKLNAQVSGFAKGMEAGARSVESFAKKVKEISEPIAGASAAVTAFGGASLALAASVDDRSSRSLTRMTSASALLAVQISDVLEPAIKSMAQGFKTAASYVAGMSDTARASAGKFALLTLSVGVGAKAIGVFAGVVASTASAVAGLMSVSVSVAGALGRTGAEIAALASRVAVSVAAMGAAPLAAIAAIVAATGLLYVAWVNDWGGMRGAVDKAIERMGVVIERAKGLGPVFRSIGSDIYDALVWPFRVFVDGLVTGLGHIQAIRAAMGAGELPGVAGLKAGLEGLSKDLKTGDAFKAALSSSKDTVAGIIEDTGKAVSEGIDALKKKVSGIVDGLLPEKGKPREAKQVTWEVGSMGTDGGTTGAEGYIRSLMATTLQTALDGKQRWVAAMDSVSYAFEQAGEAAKRRPWDQLVEGLGQRFEAAASAWAAMLGRQVTFAEKTKLATAAVSGVFDGLPKRVAAALRTDDLSKTWGKLEAGQKTIGNFMRRMGQSIMAAMGDLGTTVNSIAEGAKAGGVWGAIIAAFLELFKKMDGFQRMLDFMTHGLDVLAKALEPLFSWIFDFVSQITAVQTEGTLGAFRALQPLFDGLADVFKNLAPIFGMIMHLLKFLEPILNALAKAIGAILKALGPVIKVIFDVVKWIIVVIGGVLGVIIQVINWVEQFIAWLIEAFGDKKAAAEMRANMTDMNQYWLDLAALSTSTWDTQAAMDAATTSAWDKAIADKEAAKAAKDVAESLLNVPAGYKVAMARFNASDMNDLGWGGGSAMTDQWHDDSRDGGVPLKQPELGYDVPHRTNPTTPIVVQGDLNVSVPTGTDALGLADRTRLETAQRTGSYYSYP